ncbi:MAG: Hsp20/alpha crystallin family protein [Flavitalea sp.]
MTQLRFNSRPEVKRYDSFFSDLLNLPTTWPNVAGNPEVNISDSPNAYHLELNVPGRNKEDFKISIEKDLLTVSFEKKEEVKTEGVNTIRREFSFNTFKRSFTVDERIDTSNIQAKYDNGILKIELPKKEQIKEEAKQISIN